MNPAAVLAALASAALFGVSTPAAKALLGVVHPVISGRRLRVAAFGTFGRLLSSQPL
jgi:hypothetical protein